MQLHLHRAYSSDNVPVPSHKLDSAQCNEEWNCIMRLHIIRLFPRERSKGCIPSCRFRLCLFHTQLQLYRACEKLRYSSRRRGQETYSCSLVSLLDRDEFSHDGIPTGLINQIRLGNFWPRKSSLPPDKGRKKNDNSHTVLKTSWREPQTYSRRTKD